ncbi:MAG: acyl-CoA dehydratase activase-related protein, partial [Treponemataceae bacterium]
TSFRGLSLHKLDFTFRPDECDGCNNRCKLHVVDVNEEEIVYGYLCGREKGDKNYVSKDKSGFDLLRERAAAFRTAKRRLEARTAVSAAATPKPTTENTAGIGAFARYAFAPLINAQRRASEAVGAAMITFSANTMDTLTDAVYKATDYAMDKQSSFAPVKGEASTYAPMPTIGIPRALYMSEDAPYWQYFYEKLGFPVMLGDEKTETLAEGKRTAGAEFCAPVAMLHGQAAELLRRADYIFLPTYLEAPVQKIGDAEGRRYYCNYSQFAPAVVSLATGSRERFLRPLATGARGDDSNIVQELREAIRVALEGRGIPVPPPSEIRSAYRESRALKARTRTEYRELFLRAAPGGDDIAVLLAGRPYTLLSPGMNKGIPDIFAKHGVRAFFQDMAPIPPPRDNDSLLVAYHWRYAAEVLEAARFCARSESHYAVLVSSFKCSPDSFAAESFKRILDDAGKPYLVLQVDEHDSSVGYETRIEAAVRAFRNHAAGVRKTRSGAHAAIMPDAVGTENAEKKSVVKQKFPKDKTVLLPNWDPIVCSLLAAALRSQGLDARELEETPDMIRRAMTLNAGQCIPVSIIAREAIDYIETHKLDPEKTALWMIQALWPCNIPLYPLHIGGILEKHGNGLEKVEVYAGDITFIDLSPQAMLAVFHAFLTGGLIRKLLCRVRPYEKQAGATDAAAAQAQALIADALERGVPLAKSVKEATALFKAIPVSSSKKRPKVAVFGDFYSRDNDTFNQDLGKAIEAAGGEVIVTPYIDYLKATGDAFFDRLFLERRFGAWATYRSVLTAVAAAERSFYAKAGLDSKENGSWNNEGSAKVMETFGLRPEMEGECMDNTLKILRIVREHPDVALLVQANPAFCCPSIITESMAGEIERVTGVPVVTITYDGTGSPRNDSIMPYLAFAKEREPLGND